MNILPYTVQPKLPPPLAPLQDLARNLWVSWNHDAVNLFIRLDYDAWLQSGQNPVRVLGMVSPERLDALSQDDSYLSALDRVVARFQEYQSGDGWYRGPRDKTIAYFSMEYGLDVSLPIYSGGLGMLSGDHLKTASDLALPLVAVGLLYRQGYFQQYLNADGYQQESYPENDWYNMPVRRCVDAEGNDVKIVVDMAGSAVTARVWEVKIGRISLYLLDANIEENSAELRDITSTLYGGDRETRIRQEILLGIGGIRALRALGIEPAVAHMNEGHSAFLAIERIREHVTEHGLNLSEAIQAIWPTNIFTTHTPVPAGNERFTPELMRKYFDSVAAGTGLSWEQFMALGRENPSDTAESFCMTVLALKLSAHNNGVSALHGDVSKQMWQSLWPGLPESEIPIFSITNGVHPRTYLSQDLQELLDRYFGARFYDEPANLEIWDRIHRVSDEELWRTHERKKAHLVAFSRDRLRKQLSRRGLAGNRLHLANEVLSPDILTISFARRFATYKRATLLFDDPERLLRLVSDEKRPVQIIFAGKAHPHDDPGKNLIREIVHFAGKPEVRSRILFLENYDITIARQLVSGSDLWLNTPRRPMEASGTSGMKAAINGVLNCSTLDGWWAEAYAPEFGWAIGNGEEYEDAEVQNEIESKALYDLLEREIVPTYYDRGRDGLPRDWIRMMKASIAYMGANFASHRMLVEYYDRFYEPALGHFDRVTADGFSKAKEVAAYIDKLTAAWHSVGFESLHKSGSGEIQVGDPVTVEARLHCPGLSPEDITVEAFYGRLDAQRQIVEPGRTSLTPGTVSKDHKIDFSGTFACRVPGRQGVAVRVLPKHPDLVHPFLPGLVRWA
jgi:glycogen phosphorylase